ncbi:MAG: PD-(D/E)XK nuclease family protein [Parcubacteria group bacterium]|jgi:putative RecB family exonuclease
MNTSYSALDTFLTCPRKYKHQVIDRIKTPKSKEQFFGTLLHSTLKVVHTPGILSPTLEQALDFYSKNWNAEVFSDETEERAAFAQGVSMLQDYYKKNDPSKINIVDLESRFQVEVGSTGSGKEKESEVKEEKHIITGIIDRIDRTEDGFEIIDYKTTRKLPSQEKVDNDLQLSIYLAGFLKRYPNEIENLGKIKVSLYYLKHGVKLSSQRTLEQVKKSEELVLDLIGQIQKSDFEPTISGLCDWCGFQDICPMWKHKFKEKEPIDIDTAKIIEEYIFLKDDVKSKSDRIGELQETLSSYMDKEKVDQVFSDAGRILRSIRKTYKYEKEKLRSILEPLDKWDDVLKVDGIALKNILGVLPYETKKDVEKAKILDKESKSFVVKKGK